VLERLRGTKPPAKTSTKGKAKAKRKNPEGEKRLPLQFSVLQKEIERGFVLCIFLGI
jgi:hypothetical protein